MEQESWHRELGDGGSLAAQPAGGDAPAGAEGRGARRLRSLALQLPRSGRRLDGGGGRPTQEPVALPKPSPRGGRVGAGAPGRQISKRIVHAGLGELQDLVGLGLPRPDPLPWKAVLDGALRPQGFQRKTAKPLDSEGA